MGNQNSTPQGEKKWKVLVLFSGEDGEKERVLEMCTELKKICDVTMWPNENFVLEAKSGDEAWRELRDSFEKICHNVLVMVSTKRSEDSFYISTSIPKPGHLNADIKRLHINKAFLASKLKYMEKGGKIFELIVLAGPSTVQFGSNIDKALQSSQYPPAVVCWDDFSGGENLIERLCSYTKTFLKDTLQGRNPENQNALDLRGTLHSFVALKRKMKDKEIVEKVKFFPKNQIDEIERVYFKLGLASFELARRISSIVMYAFGKETEDNRYFIDSTIFLFAEVFAWFYILRQQPAQLFFAEEIRNLEYAFSGDTVPENIIKEKVAVVLEARNTWTLGGLNKRKKEHQAFQILKMGIRSIGERMVSFTGNTYEVKNYVEFQEEFKFKDEEDKEVYRSEFRKLQLDLESYTTEELYDGQGRLLQEYCVRLAWIQCQLCLIVKSYTEELWEEDPKLKPISILER